jgi:hypothetical protein
MRYALKFIMKKTGRLENYFINISRRIASLSWLQWTFAICFGIWGYYFGWKGGGVLGGIGFSLMLFIWGAGLFVSLPASVKEAFDRPFVLIYPITILLLFLIFYQLV